MGKLTKIQKMVVDNSPAILTAFGVVGTISTAILSAQAHTQAMKHLADLCPPDDLPLKERAIATWMYYIPPAITGCVTIACIVGANTIHTRRQAAIATAFSISESMFSDYKAKVIDVVGPGKNQSIVDAVAQDKVKENPVASSQVLVTGNGDVLCYETMSGRYFHSSMEALRRAENDINRELLTNMYASQNDFNRIVGLPSTGYGETVGWTIDKPLELMFSSVLSEEGKPCLSVGYLHTPQPDYHKFGG